MYFSNVRTLLINAVIYMNVGQTTVGEKTSQVPQMSRVFFDHLDNLVKIVNFFEPYTGDTLLIFDNDSPRFSLEYINHVINIKDSPDFLEKFHSLIVEKTLLSEKDLPPDHFTYISSRIYHSLKKQFTKKSYRTQK